MGPCGEALNPDFGQTKKRAAAISQQPLKRKTRNNR